MSCCCACGGAELSYFPTFRISHEDPGLSLNNLALFGNNGGLL